jgi:hypothetical protein
MGYFYETESDIFAGLGRFWVAFSLDVGPKYKV